jgi:hypothetical protein
MGKGDGPAEGYENEDGYNDRVSDRVEEEVHKVEKCVLNSCVEVN